MHLQTALRVISIIGYSLSLASLTVATLVMGALRSARCYYPLYSPRLMGVWMLRGSRPMREEEDGWASLARLLQSLQMEL